MTPAEVLRKAADLIEERGWWRETECVWRERRLCALFALDEATGRFRTPVHEAFMDAIGNPVGGIGYWNDAQPNGEVVIAKLREVADDLERAS
jgi:hypothetical protein